MSDVEQQGVEPQQQQAQTGPTPALEDNPERKRRINNATIFLKNSKVQASPLVRRVNFLKSKGLSEEEIVEAFNKAGQTMTMEKLKKAMESSPVVTSAPTAPSAQVSSPAQVIGSQINPTNSNQQYQQVPHQPQIPGQPQMMMPAHPQPMPMYAPPPPPPPPPPPTPPKQDRWKDVFIGVTALAGVGYVVGKLVSNYSPYTIVRRDGDPQESKPQATAPPPPQTLLPAEPSENEVQLGKDLKDAQAEVTFLKQKITELETKVDVERKEKAELNMVKGRQLGQITMLSRESDKAKKLAAELKEAQAELEKLRSQQETVPGTADAESIQASVNPEPGTNVISPSSGGSAEMEGDPQATVEISEGKESS